MSSTDGRTAPSGGAPCSIAVVMPVRRVMSAGIGTPGSTRVPSSEIRLPPRTATAPTSVIASVRWLPPVVSRSTTQKVTSRSGVPSSSKVSCGEQEVTPAP